MHRRQNLILTVAASLIGWSLAHAVPVMPSVTFEKTAESGAVASRSSDVLANTSPVGFDTTNGPAGETVTTNVPLPYPEARGPSEIHFKVAPETAIAAVRDAALTMALDVGNNAASIVARRK